MRRSVGGEPLIASCGLRNLHQDFGTTFNGAPNGIPYVLVYDGQPKVPVSFDYADESDPGPYPIPPNAPIEGGPQSTGDRHVIVVDMSTWKLYELFDAHSQNNGATWHAGSGAVFDLNSNALRPAGWTSADAAGLPIFPGLVRYDEAVERRSIEHAIRFTCPRTRKAYDAPGWTGYEVVLDVWEDLIAYGVLLVPKGLKAGERRPVVVCQHGLDGRPQDVIAGDNASILRRADNLSPLYRTLSASTLFNASTFAANVTAGMQPTPGFVQGVDYPRNVTLFANNADPSTVYFAHQEIWT